MSILRIAARVASGPVTIFLHDGYTEEDMARDLDRIERELGPGPYVHETTPRGGGVEVRLDAIERGISAEDLKSYLKSVASPEVVTDPDLIRALDGDEPLARVPPKKKPVLN